jgi:2-methylcitrate dehydratase PrpD
VAVTLLNIRHSPVPIGGTITMDLSERVADVPRLPPPQRNALAAQADLAAWSAGLEWSAVPASVRQRFGIVLADALGITTVGGRLPERAALVRAWRPSAGTALLLGTSVRTTPESAAWLNGTALVSLELDEGNKYAAGHPAAHGFPAVLALAADLDADGPTTASALLAAYEVAARFGRATRLRPGMHPHGNWGFAGAAAGCARLMGLSPEQSCAAIDTAVGMPVAGPFAAAFDGNPVRNEWIGASNLAGITAARLAASGIAHATGIAAATLGDLLGTFDPAELVAGLGRRWDVELGYFKRHSSCAFTHPAADAALLARADAGPAEIESVLVETFAAAASLDRAHWDNRLGAMFSLPYVVATALLAGEVRPRRFGAEELRAPSVAALAQAVTVRAAGEFDRALPDHRGARVTVSLRGGRQVSAAVRDPVGDAACQPFDEPALSSLLDDLLDGAGSGARVCAVARALPASASVRSALEPLAAFAAAG